MTFIGFHTSIRPEEANQKCPEFWEREYNRKYAKLWQSMKPENAVEAAILQNQIGLFAICNETETDNEYWIAGRYTGCEVPEGLSLFTFPESDWAVFEAKGPLPDSLQTLDRKVFFDWFPKEGKKRGANIKSFLEVYSPCPPSSPDYTCGLWIPVEK